MIVPTISVFFLSLFAWNDLLSAPRFIGSENFQRMVGDPVFAAAIRNTTVHLGVVLPLLMPSAFLLGYFLSRRPRGYGFLAIIFFMPGLLSDAARGMMFTVVYQPDGILNSLLRAVGLGALAHSWLADPATALWTIIGVDLWSGIGFTGVIFAAALSAVPEEIYEAARLDGASTWTIIWRIAYPLTRGFFGLMLMLNFVWLLLGSAQNVLLLTQGGPGSSSMTLSYYLFDQAFVSTRIGYSQAIGALLFVVSLAGMLLIRRSFRQTTG